MKQLANHADLIDAVVGLNGRFLERIRSFIDEEPHRNLAVAYDENQEGRQVDLGFNVFALVSDVYYRENLHSDLIVAFLNPDGAHQQRDLFLRLFLEFLRDRHNVPLRVEDYENARIEREPGKIDILISDQTSKKAIIVENKINGAGDMDRQVVRYLETVEDKWHFKCDAIAYLTLDCKKTPRTHGWTDPERRRVKPLLRSITAYEDSQEDLYHGWLAACLDATPDYEVAHVIRQYRQLLLKLGQNAMNKPLMNDCYDLMLDEERHKAALSLIAMMKDLPAYRAQRLHDEFLPKRQPFIHSFVHNSTTTIFEGLQIERGSRLKIDIETWPDDHTKVCFWDNDDVEEGILPKRILTKIGLIDAFSNRGGNGRWYARNFQFPNEEEVLRDFLDDFLRMLREYVETAKSTRN